MVLTFDWRQFAKKSSGELLGSIPSGELLGVFLVVAVGFELLGFGDGTLGDVVGGVTAAVLLVVVFDGGEIRRPLRVVDEVTDHVAESPRVGLCGRCVGLRPVVVDWAGYHSDPRSNGPVRLLSRSSRRHSVTGTSKVGSDSDCRIAVARLARRS